MSLILSIETTTAACSTALHDGGKLIAHTGLLTAHSHAAHLMSMIKHLLKIAKCDQKTLTAVAVSSGPGSYTGLRIGTTIGKGICYGLAIPLISVCTLEAMAYGMCPFADADTLLCPVIDARRTAIYTLIADKTGQIKRSTHVALLDSKVYKDTLPNRPLLFGGDAALKCKEFLMGKENIHFLSDMVPSAVQIGALAFTKFQQKIWEEIATYEPYYLSQFQAK